MGKKIKSTDLRWEIPDLAIISMKRNSLGTVIHHLANMNRHCDLAAKITFAILSLSIKIFICWISMPPLSLIQRLWQFTV